MTAPTKKTPKKAAKSALGTSLVLRVCRSDYTSRNGFAWPQTVGAEIVAPDWKDNKNCGHGLHGWLFGQGDHGCVDYWQDPDAKWYVLEVPSDSITMLGGKCKFPRAVVRFIGSRSDAAAYILAHEPKALNVAVIGLVREVGDGGVAEVGALGTATAGESGTATAGNYGTATAGESGTATAGESGTATAGNYGTATAGESGTATAGNYGTATAGNYGTATAGNYGTATAGNYGTATAGEKGELRIQWWDAKAERYRTVLGYVGEDGIKADTKYRLDDNHKFVEVSE
ncbi:putative ice nucleation protein [Bordetella bronchiseptica CARE970018BB]|uniref:DUF7666 domain-containing protein n=3 Tax=Bordetella bronchiseptica TaxID=518 RepID=UPI00046115B7|nr:hypothetical protein [Bordetella bronchiseptica]KDB80850.1 putative ice nucleation protein [Bordetella bronchiseptica CARE970018BB]